MKKLNIMYRNLERLNEYLRLIFELEIDAKILSFGACLSYAFEVRNQAILCTILQFSSRKLVQIPSGKQKRPPQRHLRILFAYICMYE